MGQGELLAPDHRSRQPGRLLKRRGHHGQDEVNAERIYAAHRLKLTRQRLSTGRTYLEAILAPDCAGCHVSRRDAAVAASVVQWLGTPCGLGFIRQAERAIDKAERALDEKLARPSLEQLQREERQPRRRALALR